MRGLKYALFGLLSMPQFVYATNGYFSHGISAAQKAMGGAGTAFFEDAFAITLNPAGMAWAGDSFEIGLSLFKPIRGYSASERGAGATNGIFSISAIQDETSHNEYWPIPAISYNSRLGENMTWGLSMFGKGGMNTEYLGNTATFGQGLIGFEAECGGGFGGGKPTGQDNVGFCGGGSDRFGVDLILLFLAPSLTYRFGDHTAIGIAPIIAMGRFASQGLGAFAQFSNSPDHVSNNGHDLSYGGGGRIGFMTTLLPGVGFGASYQMRTYMSEFEDYKGLFAEQGGFDIPSTWNLGMSFKITGNHALVLDYQKINYSEVASVSNPFNPNAFVNNCAIPRLFASMGFGTAEESPDCLGSATGPGFGWQDIEVWKLGYQFTHGRYKFRAGYSTTDQPIGNDQALFNVLAPGVTEEHFTLGGSMQWDENFFVELALMYSPRVEITGKNPLSNTDANLLGILSEGAGLGSLTGLLGADTAEAFGEDPDDQDLTLGMTQYEITFSVGWRY